MLIPDHKLRDFKPKNLVKIINMWGKIKKNMVLKFDIRQSDIGVFGFFAILAGFIELIITPTDNTILKILFPTIVGIIGDIATHIFIPDIHSRN